MIFISITFSQDFSHSLFAGDLLLTYQPVSKKPDKIVNPVFFFRVDWQI
jgi:hypothetical protein